MSNDNEFEEIHNVIRSRRNLPHIQEKLNIPRENRNPSFYDLFGLDSGSVTKEEVEKRYREVESKFSDREFEREHRRESREICEALEQAKEILLDESKRSAYNKWLLGDEMEEPVQGESDEPIGPKEEVELEKPDRQEPSEQEMHQPEEDSAKTGEPKPGQQEASEQEPSEQEKIEHLREMLSGMVQDSSITKAQQEQLAERARELELTEVENKVANMLRREGVRVLPEEQEQQDDKSPEREQQVQEREREEQQDQRQREEYGKRLRLISMAAAAVFLVIISSVAAYFLFIRSAPEVKINPPPVQPQNELRGTKTKTVETKGENTENVTEVTAIEKPGRVEPVRVDVNSVLAKVEMELNSDVRTLESSKDDTMPTSDMEFFAGPKDDTALVIDIETASMDTSQKDINEKFQSIYSFASAKVKAEYNDKILLEAQEKIFLSPKRAFPKIILHYKNLVSVAVDNEADTIVVFGLGRPPADASNQAQAKLLAHRAAVVDAYRWIGHVARWIDKPEAPFSDLSADVKGAEVIKEFWIPRQLYIVKVAAPLSKNLP
ncbi:hypothetical protein H8E77_38080 [bacterium]|nr:hypothetical protein [bacterium]